MQKINATVVALTLLLQPFYPSLAVYAQEEAVEAPVETIVASPEVAPVESIQPSEIPALETPAADTPEESPVISPEPTSAPAESAKENSDIWQIMPNGKAQTREAVDMDTIYTAPQNKDVTIHFTKLPEVPGALTIQEIHLTAQEKQEVKAISDIAYDISSTMANGTFRYTLTLPSSEEAGDVAVKYAEDIGDLSDAQEVSQQIEKQNSTVSIAGLDHFTVFVLVNDTDTDSTVNNGNEVANGALVSIADTFVDQSSVSSTHGTSSDLSVRSSTNANQRSLVKFDLASVSSGTPTVSKATLRLYMNNAPSSSRTINLHAVSGSWVEGTTNWTNQPVASASTSASATVGTSSNEWVEFDVTSDVQSMINGSLVNNGWMLRDSSENSASSRQTQFDSGNASTELHRPQLVVDLATAAQAPTQYNSPSAQTSGSGDGFENSPTNAFADGGGAASHTNNNAGESHIYSNYGFSVPAGSSISGIEVRADWWLDSTSGTNSLSTQMSWDGGTTWTSAKSDSTETDHEHIVSLGGASDTWGRSWSASDFSNANFRVRVTMNATTSSRDFFLDWLPVRVYYTPDSTAPVISLVGTTPVTIEAGAAYTDAGATASDNVDGNITNNISVTGLPVDTSVLGAHAVMYNVSDTAGNAASTVTRVVNVVDTTAPTTTDSGTDANWHTSSVTVTLTCAESIGSGCATTYYTTDGTTPTVASATGSSVVLTADGIYTVKYFSVDVTGNQEVVKTAANTVKIDGTMPTVSLSSYSPDPTNDSTPTFTGTVADNESGVVTVEFKVVDSSTLAVVSGWADVTSSGTFNSGSGNFDFTPTLSDGGYTIQVRASDAAGNTSLVASDNVVVDTTAPTTTDSGTDTNWHTSSVTVTLSCSDGSGSGCDVIYWNTDGTTPTAASHMGSGSTVLLTNDGTYTITYFAIDAAGNEEAVKTAANAVKIDTTPPTIPGTAISLPSITNAFQHIGILSLEFHVDKLSRPLL